MILVEWYELLPLRKILLIFFTVHMFFAVINFKIQKNVNKKYYLFLNSLYTLLSLHIERVNSFIEQGYSQENIKNKTFYKDMELFLSQLIRYEKITNNSSEDLENIILKLHLLAPPTEEEILKLKFKISKIRGEVKRRYKFTRYVFAPWNCFNNIFDLLIFIFLDYEYYFLQPQISRSKEIISKISFFISVLYAFLQVFYFVAQFKIPFI